MSRQAVDIPEGYRVTELGPLPEQWKVVTLGDMEAQGILRLQNGFPCGKWNDRGIGTPQLRPFNVGEDGSVVLTSLKYIETDRTLAAYVLQSGDIVFNNTNSEELVGKTALWEKPGTYVLSNHMTIIRVLRTASIVPSFLSRQLHKKWYDRLYMGLCRRHVNQASISLARLRAIPVALPSLPEQKKIAAVLSTVQQAKEKTETVIAALRELKKSLMRHLFTYGPVPVDEAESVMLKETEVGRMPQGWKVAEVGNLFDIQQGASLSPKRRAGKCPHPFLRTLNVLWGRVDMSSLDRMDFSDDEVQRLSLLPGDLLVCEGGDVGRTAMWRFEVQGCAYQNHLHRLRAATPDVIPEFYMYWMELAIVLRGFYRDAANRTTIPNLSQARLKRFPVPFPSSSEQRIIASALSEVDRSIDTEESRRNALDQLFRTLLNDLMTARICVNDLEVGP